MITERTQRIMAVLACFLLAAACWLMSSFRGITYAYAAESVGSPVLTDLLKDPSFNVDSYKQKDGDYSLNVIQIAESTDGELLIYVYQPLAKRSVKASSVNIARTMNGVSSLTFDNYKLSFIDCMDVFFKYKAEGFAIDTAQSVRYYNISNILRPFIYGVDKDAGNDNKTGEIGYRVGQLWTAITTENDVRYEKSVSEVIVVTKEMVGFKRYNDGFYFDGTKYCDAHFVAFNTNRQIDRIVSADLEFYSTAYRALKGSKETYYDPVYHKVRLTHGEIVENNGGGWFGSSNKWNRVASVNDFLHEVSWTEEESAELSKYQWVLNFYESQFVCEAGGKDVLITALVPFGFIWTIVNSCTTTGEIVSDVLLLNLEFEANDEAYSMGVVANRMTGSSDPIAQEKAFRLFEWLAEKTGIPVWAWIVIVVVVVLAILCAIPPVRIILEKITYGLWWVIEQVFYGLWLIISFPVTGIMALVKKKRNDVADIPKNRDKSKRSEEDRAKANP